MINMLTSAQIIIIIIIIIVCCYIYEGYLQLHTCDKPCFLGM